MYFKNDRTTVEELGRRGEHGRTVKVKRWSWKDCEGVEVAVEGL